MSTTVQDEKGVANQDRSNTPNYAGNKPVDINTDTKTCLMSGCESDSIPGSKKCGFHSRTRDAEIARESGENR